ncbi:CPBP family intramembrane glutamic endopeptidase [Streptomyces phaeochromogenes]|uniref:CPBP family intramembrane glutamic endopeptidase n=1 Tax=Streptomyces phaeochromogenes TaxID=1923 RepID=UPI00386D17F1|nr:CPBP family intramembrane metalloprotease [Streptomyces phaeochromogenes]
MPDNTAPARQPDLADLAHEEQDAGATGAHTTDSTSQSPITGRPPVSWSAARAYVLVLTLFALAGGPHLAGAVAAVVQQSGAEVPIEVLRVEEIGRLVGLAGAALWLLGLILTRPRPQGTGRPWGQVMELAYVLAVIVADEAGEFTAHGSTQIAGHLAELVVWVWLCVEVTARCGITLQRLNLARPDRLVRKRTKAERAQKAQGELVFYAHAAAICASVFLMGVLARLPGPVLKGDQATAAGVPDLGPHLAHALWSATVEEVLATAVAVAVLTAARRPLWEVLLVTASMRALPHLYLGLWPALSVLPLGITAGWLYHRYRRVIPLVLAHATYNVVNILFGMPPLLGVCVIMLAGVGWSWLETRTVPPRSRSRPEPRR